jgi:fatty acyl-CoA reductase
VSEVAAFFDLDGTLFDGHVWFAVTHYHRSQRINRRWLYVYLAVHFPLWYLHRLGLMSAERARYLWARNMGWTLRGFDETQASAMFRWITEEYIAPRLRPDVVERLRAHQSQGHRVLLLSGAFEGLLQTVGVCLNVAEVVGTRLRRRNGRYVGAPLPPVCQGEGKIQRLRKFLRDSDAAVDLAVSYAYADSMTDLPVFEAVGHPVVVYPEGDLAVLADQRGWPILGTSG